MPLGKSTFVARGRGMFPIDMLRYDQAWPSSSADADRIRESFTPGTGPWEVKLSTADRAAPTIARWASFNVQVQ